MLFDPIPQLKSLEIPFQHPTKQPASLSLHISCDRELTILQSNSNYQKVWTQELQTQMLPMARQAIKMNESSRCRAGEHMVKWDSHIQFKRGNCYSLQAIIAMYEPRPSVVTSLDIAREAGNFNAFEKSPRFFNVGNQFSIL